MDAPVEERVPDYGTHAEASASQQSSHANGQEQQNAHSPYEQTSGQQTSGQQTSGQQTSGQPTPSQSTSSQPNVQQPAQRQRPNSSGQRGAAKDPSRAPSFAEKQRYGEAVVREILGATFIEEQPYTAAPRTRNDY
ncbi:hypothetical protein [Cryobacterium sp. Y50]|uniref:hypothetical protein n=1 Tax=Cryobacterium sp. Y50 TaxID=2048286 RepID=UPI001304F955|nr:hypothetical protein [Cryobacterium sp. Y50]